MWEDHSLADWSDDDFRIFCGDLGNDVNDELLTRTFNKYPSFNKAKVIRDKRTGKSKGFGFISFKEPGDFIRAMKEMDGEYTFEWIPKWEMECILTCILVKIILSWLSGLLAHHLPFDPQPFDVNKRGTVPPLLVFGFFFCCCDCCWGGLVRIGLFTCKYFGWTMINGGLDSPQPLDTVTVLVTAGAVFT